MYSDKLIFYERPAVRFANNIFTNVPTILQFDDTPIISVKKALTRKHYVHIQIFQRDGTELAVCDSLRLFLTDEGRRTNLKIAHPQDNMTVCTLDGRTLFELTRTGLASLSIQSELYTPTGCLIKCNSEAIPLSMFQDQTLLGSTAMSNCDVENCDVGVWCKSDGNIDIGCNVGEARQRA